ncbi:hypothetical protein [Methylobacterium sp. yr596]|uniref:hypothetical protein n=1 Tax=Methylobacterium sp. yr596 TaxID=1761800 RepID=UPI0008F22664|nr:hypothetical protein [Methylobacterium sp. yr596]SFF76843.1 hypothetical protein SAMN04487844_14717 [Methylobacterium sp. yr596]
MLENTEQAAPAVDDTAAAQNQGSENASPNTEQPAEGESPRQEGEANLEQPEGEPEARTEDQPEGEQQADDGKPKLPAWVQRRIDELTRQRHEEARARQALEAQLRDMQGNPADPEQQVRQGELEQAVRQQNPALTQDQIRQAAAEMRRQERFTETCNATFEEGVKRFPDFQQTLQQFSHLGGLPNDFVEDALAAGSAHLTLHHLGRNLDEADRIMRLPTRERAVALARLSDKLAAPPPPKPLSRAPAPVDPVGGAGRPSTLNTDPDSMSTAEWMRRRDAGEIR